MTTPENLVPIDMAHIKFPNLFPSKSNVKYLLLKRKENGFSSVVVKIGRRLFIDEKNIPQWLESKREAA